MPYADKTLQRKAVRESTQRMRARQRETVVKPALLTFEELAMAGRILGRRKGPQETQEEYQQALRLLWRHFLAVVEPE
jgi:hypothetical protein